MSASYEVPVHVLDGAGGSSSSVSYSYIGSTGQATPMGPAASASFRYRAGYIPQLASFLAPSDCWDGDGDTYDDEACGGTDCDDADPNVAPGAPETADGRDEDCDGAVLATVRVLYSQSRPGASGRWLRDTGNLQDDEEG